MNVRFCRGSGAQRTCLPVTAIRLAGSCRRLTGQTFWVANDVVWWPEAPEASPKRVAVVSVSYNTRELTGFLLWSLRRIVDWPELEIVIVGNGSRDGSAELLAEASRAGLCALLANDVNRRHGPGLNQGISWLASRPGPLPGWIWILDSDVIAARPEVLGTALTAAQAECAALAGEPQRDQWHQVERFGLYSLLLDPAQVWRPGTGPFTDGGDPAFDLLSSAVRSGLRQAAFPFTVDGHVILVAGAAWPRYSRPATGLPALPLGHRPP